MKCKDCEYYLLNEGMYYGAVCRRYPPTPLCGIESGSSAEEEISSSHYNAWPEVQEDDWCGEFKEKEKGFKI